MEDFVRILKIRLDESLDISRLKHSTKIQEKLSFVLYKVIMVLAYIIAFSFIFAVYKNMASAGLAEVLPTMSYFFSSALCIFITIMSINEMLSGNADSEFLLSTPVSEYASVLIMVLGLYLRCLAVVLMFELPAAIVFASTTGLYSALPRLIWGMLITSLPLGGIACLIGTVISLVLAHSPKREQIKTGISMSIIAIGSIIVVVIVSKLGALLNIASANSDQIVADALKLFVGNFRFARMYQYAMLDRVPGYFAIFSAASIIWYVGFGFAFVMGYRNMIISFKCPVDYKKYDYVPQKQTSIKKALFNKELQQLTKSQTYMTRSMMGIIVGSVVILSTLLFGPGLITQVISETKIMMLICLFIGLSNTTYCSISIEGKRHWISGIAPIDEKIMFSSKVYLNLVFTIPFAIISGIILGITVSPSTILKICYVVVPVIFAIINAYWGIFMDYKFGDYSKESEDQAMHQGLSYVLGYLPGILIPIILCL